MLKRLLSLWRYWKIPKKYLHKCYHGNEGKLEYKEHLRIRKHFRKHKGIK